MASKSSTELKVGVFVIVALFLGGVMVFTIGKAQQTFDPQITVYSSFSKVSGLKVGSLVRLAGYKIGVVSAIDIRKAPLLEPAPGNKVNGQKNGKRPPLPAPSSTAKRIASIRVSMKINRSFLKWVRKDSVATIEGKGLLGDSLVEITIGTSKETLSGNMQIKGVTPRGISDFLKDSQTILADLKTTMAKIKNIITDRKLNEQFSGIVTSVNDLLARSKNGPGLLHDLVYSKKFARTISRIAGNVQRSTRNLTNTTSQLNSVLARSRRPGTLFHRLVISRRGGRLIRKTSRILSSAQRSVNSLNDMLASSKRPGTVLYKVFRSRKTGKIVDDVAITTKSVRRIITKIESGKGSLGALINDPTAYEDFKTILGQIKRSRVFRSLVRFIIQRDDSVKGGKILKRR